MYVLKLKKRLAIGYPTTSPIHQLTLLKPTVHICVMLGNRHNQIVVFVLIIVLWIQLADLLLRSLACETPPRYQAFYQLPD